MSRKWTYEIGYGYESILRDGVMVNKEQAVRALNNYETRIAELEEKLVMAEKRGSTFANDNHYLQIRIAELERENAMLKQFPQPIELWSDEKKQVYKINERRTIKSGNEVQE